VVNAKPISLGDVIGAYLIKIISLLIGQGSRPLLPIGWTNFQIKRCSILPLTSPTGLRYQHQATQP
jgi:hypothetical protein